MARVVVKLLSEDKKADLDTAITAYKGGAGSDLDDFQRGMAYAMHTDAGDGDRVMTVALAHAGLDSPTSGNKTADLQHLVVDDDKLAAGQTALDLALADSVHHAAVVADAVTTVAGVVSSAAGTPFVAGDVGRKIRIASEVRTITVFNSTSNVDYDNSTAAGGDFASGSGLTLDLLGAETLQDMQLATRVDDDGDLRVTMFLAIEGELP